MVSSILRISITAKHTLPTYHFAGGRVLAGGGLSIPKRLLSPVVLRFQITEIL
jgi:hypothetical protein